MLADAPAIQRRLQAKHGSENPGGIYGTIVVKLPRQSRSHRKRTGMPDDPKDTIEFAIRSAFVSYPKDDDPDWRSPHWITGKECAYMAMAIILELQAKGFQIVKKAS